MKTYVLIVSKQFPKKHPRAGERTDFIEKILNALNSKNICYWEKKHTLRVNYDLWKKRIDEVVNGKAVISLRYWEGKPYRSKQITFATRTAADGIGVQMGVLTNLAFSVANEQGGAIHWKHIPITDVAENDGLSRDDFKAWLKGYDLSEPLAIIHFTKFRY